MLGEKPDALNRETASCLTLAVGVAGAVRTPPRR